MHVNYGFEYSVFPRSHDSWLIWWVFNTLMRNRLLW